MPTEDLGIELGQKSPPTLENKIEWFVRERSMQAKHTLYHMVQVSRELA